MARRIDHRFEIKRGPKFRYPWTEWFDGSAWEIRRGTDFELTPDGMEGVIRQRASREGVSVSVQRTDDGEGLMFQAFAREAA
jgi:hypothetical protein